MNTLKSARSPRDLEAQLLDALRTKDLVIRPEDLNGRSLVSLLRERLAQP
jgi:hypothetical protein